MRPFTFLCWLLFFAAPFLEPNIYPDGIARDLFVLASALLTTATFSHQNNDQTINIYSWFFLLILLLPNAILLANHSAQAPWFVWRQSLYFTAAWLVFAMLGKQHNPASWMFPLLLFAHLYVIYALIEAFHLQWFSNGTTFLFWSDKTAHFPGPLRQQNQQALFLVLAIIFTWRQTMQTTYNLRWETLSLLPITGVFLTASRSGLIVLILAALLIWVSSRLQRQTLWMLMRTMAVGASISVAILAIAPTQDAGGVVAHIQHGLTDNTPSIRVMVWTICLHLWLQHPWLGVGWGNLAAHLYDAAAPVMQAHPEFNAIASNLSGGVTKAHNIILQFLVEGGIVACSALLLLFVALGRQAQQWWRKPPQPQSHAVTGWICAIVILAHGMVSVAAMEPFFMVILAISLAACFSENNDVH